MAQSTTPHNADARRRPGPHSSRQSKSFPERRSRLATSVAHTCSEDADAAISALRCRRTARKSDRDTSQSSPPAKGYSNSHARTRESRRRLYKTRFKEQEVRDSRPARPTRQKWKLKPAEIRPPP